MANVIEGLSGEALEQLRYIVDVMPEWPDDALSLWVGLHGQIYSGSEWLFKGGLESRFCKNSPDFTREQYEATKAQMQPKLDWEAMARELAEMLNCTAQIAFDFCRANGATYDEDIKLQDARAALAKFRAMGGKV